MLLLISILKVVEGGRRGIEHNDNTGATRTIQLVVEVVIVVVMVTGVVVTG